MSHSIGIKVEILRLAAGTKQNHLGKNGWLDTFWDSCITPASIMKTSLYNSGPYTRRLSRHMLIGNLLQQVHSKHTTIFFSVSAFL